MELYFLMLFFGLVFSIPTYILYSFVFSFLKDKKIKTTNVKVILISIFVIGTFTTTAIIDGSSSFTIALSYSIVTAITGLILKLNSKSNDNKSWQQYI
jgi:Sec-independent protein secretion pathway component TatC